MLFNVKLKLGEMNEYRQNVHRMQKNKTYQSVF